MQKHDKAYDNAAYSLVYEEATSLKSQATVYLRQICLQ